MVAAVFLNVACNNQKEVPTQQEETTTQQEETTAEKQLTQVERDKLEEIAKKVKENLEANYRVEKIENGYTIIGNTNSNKSVTTIKDRATAGIGDYLFTRDENGNLVVTIQSIGTVSFKVDTLGNLEAVIKK